MMKHYVGEVQDVIAEDYKSPTNWPLNWCYFRDYNVSELVFKKRRFIFYSYFWQFLIEIFMANRYF